MLISKKQIMARRSSRSYSKSKGPCGSKSMKGKRCPGKSRKGKKSPKRRRSKLRSRKRSSNNANNMRAGAYYSFNSKDPVGGLPAVVRHTDDCPTTSPQSIDFGTALYGAAKSQTGGACGCGKVIGGARRRRRSSKKTASKKSRSKDRSSGKKGKGSSGKKGKKRSHKKSHKKRGPGC